LVAKINEAFAEKVERTMTAVAFAEGGLFDTAKRIIKKDE
jgi:tripartite-type tricarboxylate transporter receptor subunit TctC